MTFGDLVARSWSGNRLFSVLLELTYRCNLDCFFCYNDLSLRGEALTLERYVALLDELAAMGALNVTLSGGEPLSHPDFFGIGAAARERGFVVRVKSNGHALRGDLVRRLRDEVDPFVVEVSLHGATAATHDRQTRIAGSFARLNANLREMLDAGLRVKVNSTLTCWNEGEVEGMYALTDALGLPLRFDLQVSPRDDGNREPMSVAPSAEGIRHLLAVDTARFRRAHGEESPEPELRPAIDGEMPAPSGKHCGAGSGGIAIDPYGNVYPCVQWRRAVGNLHESTLRELWDGPKLGEVRSETEEAARVVAAHPAGRLLNFCPGLAEVLTGSATKVPPELEARAAIVATSLESSAR